MNKTKKPEKAAHEQTIDYGSFGTLKVIPIEKTLINELDLEIYSKVAPLEPTME
jgi:hypothetical protein